MSSIFVPASGAIASSNKVLRNTYALLALTLLPTIGGAWLGVSTGLLMGMSPIMSMLIFMGVAFGMMYAISANKDSATGVYLLLAFTFFMGIMLSRMLSFVLTKDQGVNIIALAFGGTATVFLGMSFLATVIKRDLSFMGKFLFVGVIMLLVASIGNIFFQSGALSITISVLALGIFSAYLLYDIKQIIDGGETNYVMATLSIYLSLYNIFQSLLHLLGITSDD